MPVKVRSFTENNDLLSLVFLNDEMPVIHYKGNQDIQFVKAHITESLIDILSMLNVGKGITARQIEFTVEMILQDKECRNLKPCEIEQAIKNGITGKCGKIYDRVDVSVIFEWLNKYMDERFDEIIRYREIEQREYRSLANRVVTSKEPISEAGKEVLKTLIEKFTPDYKKPDFDTELIAPLQRVLTHQEEKTKLILKEFNDLILAGCATKKEKNIPFVYYNDKWMNEQEYHNVRWCEIDPLN